MKRILLPLTTIFLFVSCQKELSLEIPGGNTNPGTNTNPPLGANCKVKQILAVDSATGIGLLSVFTTFQPPTGNGTKVEIFDSISSNMQYEANLQYINDTVRVSPTDYFLLDGTKRVKSFRTIDYSGTTQDTLTYQYLYDGNGYLTAKEVYVTSLPIPVIRFTYIWSGQNLVSVDGTVAVPGVSQKILTATLEYDANATAKNFLPIFPDGFETSLFVMALNLGKPAKNLVKKMTITTYDESGNLDEVLVSNYGNYKFSSDGYLIEWIISGELLGGSPFVEGMNKFNYYCQ